MANPLFAFHKLNDVGQSSAKAIAQSFEQLLLDIAPLCEDSGREWALVKTHLETACFFAKKAMATQASNQG